MIEDWIKQNIPCQSACPLGIDISGFIDLITKRRYREADTLIRMANPLPLLTSRLCSHHCENTCKWKEKKLPIAIKNLERFASEYSIHHQEEYTPDILRYKQVLKGKRIAVIGSGILGLALAKELNNLGANIEVIEKNDRPGGRLNKIPPSILAPELIDYEVKLMMSEGIVFVYPLKLQPTHINVKMRVDYDATYLAVGTPVRKKVKIIGSNKHPVYEGYDFIKRAFSGEKMEVGDKVAILGGDDIAFWCGRIAKKMDVPDVDIYFYSSKYLIDASGDNIELCEKAGVKFQYLVKGLEILGSKSVKGIKLQKMKLAFDSVNNTYTLVLWENEYFNTVADTVIITDRDLLKPDEYNIEKELYDFVEDLDKGLLVPDSSFKPDTNIVNIIAYAKKEAARIAKLFESGKIKSKPDFKEFINTRKENQSKNIKEPFDKSKEDQPVDYNNHTEIHIIDADESVSLKDKTILKNRAEAIYTKDYLRELSFFQTSEDYAGGFIQDEAARCLNCHYQISLDDIYQTCIGCKACVDICPNNCYGQEENNIKMNNYKYILNSFIYPKFEREKDCTRCFTCVRECPAHVIKIKENIQPYRYEILQSVRSNSVVKELI